jgi:hypothetical protein
MNRKEGKKIAVMAAVIVGLMMFAFMPLASTGLAGAVDSYNMLVTTDGVSEINITIPKGFIAVAPTTGGVLLAEVNFWNSTIKAYYGHATITSNDTNWTEQVKVYCEFLGDSMESVQNVNYTAGATTTIESNFTSDTSTAIIELPTEDADGSIKISINCTEFQLDDVMIAIKQCVRNPTAKSYEFIADGESAWVDITGPSGRGIVFRDGVWFVDRNGDHIADVVFNYGTTGDVPLVWGANRVAIFNNGKWTVKDIGDLQPDLVFYYGIGEDVPLVGDMNRDGIVDIAVFRNGTWFVHTSVATITSYSPVGVDLEFPYGIGEDVPLVGDMNRDGTDDIAVFRNGTWFIDITGFHAVDRTIPYGIPGDEPLVGDFDRDGIDDIAVFRDGIWYVDITGLGILPPTFKYTYGIVGDVPLVGIIEEVPLVGIIE